MKILQIKENKKIWQKMIRRDNIKDSYKSKPDDNDEEQISTNKITKEKIGQGPILSTVTRNMNGSFALWSKDSPQKI